ncbi:hypothetical protein P7C70_g2144, partial [Phenoliferia sp. Uapishka_3]
MRGEECVWTDAVPTRAQGELDLESAHDEIKLLKARIKELNRQLTTEAHHQPSFASDSSYPPSPAASEGGSSSWDTTPARSSPKYPNFPQAPSSYPSSAPPFPGYDVVPSSSSPLLEPRHPSMHAYLYPPQSQFHPQYQYGRQDSLPIPNSSNLNVTGGQEGAQNPKSGTNIQIRWDQ